MKTRQMNASSLFEVVMSAKGIESGGEGEESCYFIWNDHGKLSEEVKLWLEA